MKSSRLLLVVPLLCLGGAAAELSVRGFGPLRNMELKNTLELLLDEGGGKRETLDAAFVEDAALVLGAELVEDGFSDARVEASWLDAQGVRGSLLIDPELSRAVPRPLAAKELRLEARPGTRAVVAAVRFEGLEAIPVEEAEQFFRPVAGLFTPDRVRAFSPQRVRRAAGQLRDALRARGHSEARVEIAETDLDRATGAVRLVVRVEQGPLWRVADWRHEVAGGGEWLGGDAGAKVVGRPWTRTLAEDLARETRAAYHALGYADARIGWEAAPAAAADGERAVTALARVEPGEPWRIGAVRFEGAERTRAELLEERARLESGAPFDPVAIDAARLRLARLGVFRRVEAEGEPAGPGERDLVFRLVEEAPWEGAWSLGYGSYEQLRGSAEFTRNDLWGLAHRDRVELGQSVKASRGQYRYTVPTLFSGTVEGSARVFGLRREEPSFVRLEYGAGVEASREVPWIEARGTAGLTYEVLRADEVELGVAPDEATETTVTSFNLGLARDRRDNPLRPRAGQRWSLRSETALPELGSEVRYERLEAAWSWHRAVGEGRWAHLGVSHGLILDSGDQVPVNRLFFPGGESSIRGYAEGEASPRGENGRYVGARSVWLVNLELEQWLTGRWTGVLFSDTLGTAVEVEEWPGEEVLGSAGLGLRYQSPIGPVRLEYAWNLNPREADPSGTLHFSIGFPF